MGLDVCCRTNRTPSQGGREGLDLLQPWLRFGTENWPRRIYFVLLCIAQTV